MNRMYANNSLPLYVCPPCEMNWDREFWHWE